MIDMCLLRRLATTLLLCAPLILGGLGAVQPAFAQDGFSDSQKQGIEQIVRDYLVENPEVIRDAIEALQAKEQAAKAGQQAGALTRYNDQLLADPASPVAGNPMGDVTIIEFFDYKCPYCKRVTPALTELLEADKGIRIVFKEFPILGQSSVTAARAALAAGKQDRYLDFHTALMAHRGDFDEAAISTIADSLGLDLERLKADMKAPDIDAQLRANHDLAMALAIRSTPTFIVGEHVVPGALSIDDMKELVAEARSN